MRKLLLVSASALALAAIAIVAAAVVSSSSAAASAPHPDLVLANKATAKYHDPAVALADGFAPASPCVVDPATGNGMGVHWDHFFRVRDLELDPERPDILLYQPTPDGPRLVGVEYWIIDIDQNLATDFDRPSMFGVPFDGPMLGHAPGMPIHYDLHVWLWRHNPDGMFKMFNPKVDCP